VYAPSDAAGARKAKLVEAGAAEMSEDTAETLRIEAGRPRFGIDMSSDTIPLEAGVEDRAISFTKGCYVGQEVIIRVMHRGHGRVTRRLVSMALHLRPKNLGEVRHSRELRTAAPAISMTAPGSGIGRLGGVSHRHVAAAALRHARASMRAWTLSRIRRR
jgi:hypothetical protein